MKMLVWGFDGVAAAQPLDQLRAGFCHALLARDDNAFEPRDELKVLP